jgi:hypothetical protein
MNEVIENAKKSIEDTNTSIAQIKHETAKITQEGR